jgi:hypothetical protein
MMGRGAATFSKIASIVCDFEDQKPGCPMRHVI